MVDRIYRSDRLANIAGGNATWCLSSKIPLVVAAQQWSSPRRIYPRWPEWDELDVVGDQVRLHWSYFAQDDPELVFRVLTRLQLRAYVVARDLVFGSDGSARPRE